MRLAIQAVFLSTLLLLLPRTGVAQSSELQVLGAWGTNLLTSPGADLESSPARSGHFSVGLLRAAGREGNTLEAGVRLSGNAYHTRMAYRTFFVSQRTTMGLDLLRGFGQGGGSSFKVGFFADLVLSASATVYQQGQNTNLPIFNDPRINTQHIPTDVQAGVVLGWHIPLGSGRLGLDIQLRQHLVPLVGSDQSFAIPFQAEQQVLSTNTRATVLLAGLSYRITRYRASTPAE